MAHRPPPEPTYRIQVAAELSGVSVELLRAWEKRYAVVRPRRTPGGYRVYTAQDVAVLRRLRELVAGGMAIAEAARLVPRLREEAARVGAPAAAGSPLLQWRQALLAAAEALDQAALAAALDTALAAASLPVVMDEVLTPVLHEAGERWHAGTLTVAQEHLLSQAVRTRLLALLHAGGTGAGLRHAVLACFPEEQHELGLLGVAVRLRQAGWRVTLLGPRLPAEELAASLRRLSPQLVGLSCAVDPGPATVQAVLAAVQAGAPGARVWLGGAGVRAHARGCERAGARLFRGADDWPLLLG